MAEVGVERLPSKQLIDSNVHSWILDGIDNKGIVEFFARRQDQLYSDLRYDDITIGDECPTCISDLLSIVIQIARDVYKDDSLYVEDVWGQFRTDGEALPYHNHEGSPLAVAYYASYPKGSAGLDFWPFGKVPLQQNYSATTIYGQTSQLLMFPGWLYHSSVRHSNKNAPRVVVSANIGYTD